MSLSYRILIVGCGQLGSRHLQAVASLPMVHEVEIVDPRPQALENGRKLLTDMPKNQNNISFRWVSSLEEASGSGDLCIVGTLARGRAGLIQQVVEQLGYRSFIVEKIVTQSAGEYEGLLELAQKNKLSIWVNCKSRAYPIQKHIKARLNSKEPLLFNVVGGRHGLATYGIHVADLFAFHDGSDEIFSAGASVDSILHPSKRGPEYFDLSGTLMGATKKGSHLTISFAKDHMASDQLSIVTKSYRCIVDHMQQWAFENYGEKGEPWRPISFDGNLLVSQMTKTFATDILTRGTCELPTLKSCWPAHRFILNQLLPHFNRLLKQESDYCPVT